ncbi:hypothetical protein Vafri_1411 [Volvox africanus]|nr:hypothetical protein Vafri_1411 [Volvox africanus]
MPKSRVGTVTYMAPEVLRAGPSRRYDGHKADIWSAGIVLYVMLFARAPFDDPLATNDKARRDATMQQILRGEWTAPPSIPVAPECLDLLRGILAADPAVRFSMAQIMTHPWFSVGLPPAALTMNTVLVRQQTAQPPPYEQSVEEVNSVLAEAQRKGPPAGACDGGVGVGDMTDSGFMTMVRSGRAGSGRGLCVITRIYVLLRERAHLPLLYIHLETVCASCIIENCTTG